MSGRTILLNISKVKRLVDSTLGDDPTTHKVGKLIHDAKRGLTGLGGCSCRQGPQKSKIYETLRVQLRTLSDEDLLVVKAFFGATTLNLGGGREI